MIKDIYVDSIEVVVQVLLAKHSLMIENVKSWGVTSVNDRVWINIVFKNGDQASYIVKHLNDTEYTWEYHTKEVIDAMNGDVYG